MRATTTLTTSNLKSWEELQRFVSQDIQALALVVNGRLGFTDNCQTSLVTVVFPAANQTVQVQHGIGIVPSGYILAGATVDLRIFDGNRANTSQNIYLQASGAGTARVLVF